MGVMSESGGEQQANKLEFDADTLQRAERIIRLSELGASASAIVHINGEQVRLVGSGDSSVTATRIKENGDVIITSTTSEPTKLDVEA